MNTPFQDWLTRAPGGARACTDLEVAHVLGSQDVTPPAAYIEFLELAGRGLEGRGRGRMLYYPECLEIRARMQALGVPEPPGFAFALQEVDNQEDAYFSTCSIFVFWFQPNDETVFVSGTDNAWKPERAADSLFDWLRAL